MTLYGGAEQYTSLRKRQLLAHELGHFWGIDDLYHYSTTLESIYSDSYNFETATRHDFNALRIGLGNLEYDTGSSDSATRWKYQKSPNVWATMNRLM